MEQNDEMKFTVQLEIADLPAEVEAVGDSRLPKRAARRTAAV